MKVKSLFIAIVAFSVLSGCGSSESKSGSLLSEEADSNSEVFTMSGNDYTVDIIVKGAAEVDQPVVYRQDGWFVLSFGGESPLKAEMNLSASGNDFQGVQLTLAQGSGSVVVSPTGKLMVTGGATGRLARACGPRGAVCTTEIPALSEKDLSYPCGPQGVMCTVILPGI